MSATMQQDCYAALWCALFNASLDRYAGQGELFNRDRGPELTGPASSTWPDPDDAADPGLNDLPLPKRPRPRALHEPDAERAAENLQGRVDLGRLDLGPRPGPMFPGIERTPEHHWIERSTVVPTESSARLLANTEGDKHGFHVGEVVPAGQMWRVNRLYRFPRVQYPQPNA